MKKIILIALLLFITLPLLATVPVLKQFSLDLKSEEIDSIPEVFVSLDHQLSVDDIDESMDTVPTSLFQEFDIESELAGFRFASQSLGSWVQQGLAIGQDAARQAYGRLSSGKWKRIAKRVYNRFNTVTVHRPGSGRDFIHCINNPNVLAYTQVNSSNIYLCQKIIKSSFYQTKELAQTLVHEVAHTIGYGNECDATNIEVTIMRNSSYGLRYKNGYWNRCF